MLTEKNVCYNCFQEIDEAEKVCPHCGYDHEENAEKYPMALKAGSVLNGQYILGRVLGQGGFGITYLALDYNLGMKLAIKEYLPETMAIRETDTVSVRMLSANKQEDFNYGADCFLKEARLLAQFSNNPNIVSVRNYFSENNTAYFVMEYIEGISFKQYIKNHGGKIDYTDALRIMLPVLDGLSAVHQEGIIHRDVAPDNIYITKDDAVKLLDFGSARYSIGDRSRSLDVIIKAGYAPKEQYTRRGRQGPFTDVYSAAACLYASITGYLPPEALDRLDNDELVSISTYGIKLPETIEDAILKGLEVQPEDRFQTIAEFKQALTAVSDPVEVETLSSEASVTPTAPTTAVPVSPVKPEAPGSPVSAPSDQNNSLAPEPPNPKKNSPYKKIVIAVTCACVLIAGAVIAALNWGFIIGKTSDTSYTIKTSAYTVSGLYTGGWRHNRPSGEGTFVAGDDLVEFATVDGATIWLNEDSILEGKWVDGLLEGPGRVEADDGDLIEGNFSKGMLNGEGTCKTDSYKYTGAWKDNLSDGKGTYVDDDRIIEGTWKIGERNGTMTITKDDGYQYILEYKNGKAGKGVMINPSGKRSNIDWSD